MKTIAAVKSWRASRSTTIGTLSAQKRFEAAATKRARGRTGATWRDLR